MKKYFIPLAIVLCVLFLTGFVVLLNLSGSESNIDSESGDYATPDQHETEPESELHAQAPQTDYDTRADDEAATVDNESTLKAFSKSAYPGSEDLSSWLGNYFYFESFLHIEPDHPTMSIEYNVYIKEDDDSLYAEIDDWGWQTRHHIRAKIIGDECGIDLLFEDYLEEHGWGEYQEGDLLLSLSRDPGDNQLYTTWNEIRCNTSYIDEEMIGNYYEKVA